MSSAAPASLASHWVMRLEVDCAPPVVVGETDAGLREDYPILGGSFVGNGLHGEVLPGADRFLRRVDGVGVLDARYALRTSDGVLIHIHNRGVLWAPPGPDGRPKEGGPFRCHCVPRFEAPQGRYAWLDQGIFAGRVSYPALGQVHIDLFLFD